MIKVVNFFAKRINKTLRDNKMGNIPILPISEAKAISWLIENAPELQNLKAEFDKLKNGDEERFEQIKAKLTDMLSIRLQILESVLTEMKDPPDFGYKDFFECQVHYTFLRNINIKPKIN